MLLWGVFILFLTISKQRDKEEWFWISFAIKNFLIISIAYILGIGVLYRGWYVGYTRKIVHISFYLLTFLLDLYLPLP